jgi:predicted 3-demethylubiquinone-9 3-methyltransferase (glyoxalase superfamily)
MNFYVSIFKNSKILEVVRYGDAGPGPKGTVMAGTFQLEGQQFMALNGGPHFKFTEAMLQMSKIDISRLKQAYEQR